MIDFLVVCQLLTTSFLTGLIWFVQLVHYPLFKEIPLDVFSKYHRKHMIRTSFIVSPLMIIEAVCAIALAFVFERQSMLYFLAMTNLIILGLIWLATFGLQAPRHLKLKLGHHMESIEILIQTNWIRTILWTLRVLILLIILNEVVSFKS